MLPDLEQFGQLVQTQRAAVASRASCLVPSLPRPLGAAEGEDGHALLPGSIAARSDDCRLGTLDLTKATNTHLELRTSGLSALDGLEGLRGAIGDDGQLTQLAPAFVAHLGLVVE